MKLTTLLKESYGQQYIFFEITAKCHVKDSHFCWYPLSLFAKHMSSHNADESHLVLHLFIIKAISKCQNKKTMQSILKFVKCIFLLLFSIFLFPICSFCRFQLYDIIVYRPLTNNQQILKKKIMIVVCADSFSWLQLSRYFHGMKQELDVAILLSA